MNAHFDFMLFFFFPEIVQPENSVVLWDRIVTSPKHARINLQEARQKYEFKTPDSSFG
jgi:signal peptidase complex subunit 3